MNLATSNLMCNPKFIGLFNCLLAPFWLQFCPTLKAGAENHLKKWEFTSIQNVCWDAKVTHIQKNANKWCRYVHKILLHNSKKCWTKKPPITIIHELVCAAFVGHTHHSWWQISWFMLRSSSILTISVAKNMSFFVFSHGPSSDALCSLSSESPKLGCLLPGPWWIMIGDSPLKTMLPLFVSGKTNSYQSPTFASIIIPLCLFVP